MVVTRKGTNPNAPPAPSRTNSSNSTPKAAKKASVKGPSHLKESHLAAFGVEDKPVAPPMPKPHIPAPHPEDEGPFGQNPTFLVSRSVKTSPVCTPHPRRGPLDMSRPRRVLVVCGSRPASARQPDCERGFTLGGTNSMRYRRANVLAHSRSRHHQRQIGLL